MRVESDARLNNSLINELSRARQYSKTYFRHPREPITIIVKIIAASIPSQETTKKPDLASPTKFHKHLNFKLSPQTVLKGSRWPSKAHLKGFRHFKT